MSSGAVNDPNDVPDCGAPELANVSSSEPAYPALALAVPTRNAKTVLAESS